jgi:hypothetical protein
VSFGLGVTEEGKGYANPDTQARADQPQQSVLFTRPAGDDLDRSADAEHQGGEQPPPMLPQPAAVPSPTAACSHRRPPSHENRMSDYKDILSKW